MPSYCGLCNVVGPAGVPRPEGETREEFNAHVASHDPVIAEAARLTHTANSFWPGAESGPSGCWCICHLGAIAISRETCDSCSTDPRVCYFCGRVGEARYRRNK
jgi:hypothetical protein